MDFEEREKKIKMIADLLLLAILLILTVLIFSLMHKLPHKLLTKFRRRNTSHLQARRHFVAGAQLLSQAKSSKSNSAALAKSAADEADKSIALDPKDAAAHILKALALDLQGFKSSAVDAIDVALSPLAAKSLAEEERGDALFKRAELKLGLSGRGRRLEEVVEDLMESIKLKKNNARAFCLLGECYEKMEMSAEAVAAYESAVGIDAENKTAQEALTRLKSS